MRNMQLQYPLPFNWVTKFPHWPGFLNKGRSLEGNDIEDEIKPTKSDSTRKIAYELIEDTLNK